MNKTDLFVYGRNFGKKGSFIAVAGVFNDGTSWYRSMSCGSLTTNQSELKAVELALQIVNPNIKDNLITLYVMNRYVQNMLDRDGNRWTKEPQTSKGLVNKVRELLLSQKKYAVQLADSSCKHVQFVKELMGAAVASAKKTEEQRSP